MAFNHFFQVSDCTEKNDCMVAICMLKTDFDKVTNKSNDCTNKISIFLIFNDAQFFCRKNLCILSTTLKLSSIFYT